MKMKTKKTLQTMSKNSPLIHHITNWVTINHCAQVVRHWRCLPVMAHAIEEVEEMAGLASALVLNIGTLTPGLIESMLKAAAAANNKGIPVVLDAVGAGATNLRTDSAQRIFTEARVDLLKGNAGEIATLAGVEAEVRGVESVSVGGDISEAAKGLAGKLENLVAVTGPTDLVTDGDKVIEVSYGHPIMGKVVGTGCISSSTLGCFLAAGEDRIQLAAMAFACFGIAGERASLKCEGPGDFMSNFFNQVASMASEAEDIEVEVKQA